MVSASFWPLSVPSFQISTTTATLRHLQPQKNVQIGFCKKTERQRTVTTTPPLCSSLSHRALPLAASLAILLCSNPAKAGFLSGLPGIESVPGPQLPQIDFLNRFNEENQKKYAEADARFKSSPLLKELLERSKLNKEKNRQETLDKYCIRGAEWGIGDCSTDGMSPEDRDNFIAMLKQKAGVKE